jgi:hypothetical protein
MWNHHCARHYAHRHQRWHTSPHYCHHPHHPSLGVRKCIHVLRIRRARMGSCGSAQLQLHVPLWGVLSPWRFHHPLSNLLWRDEFITVLIAEHGLTVLKNLEQNPHDAN